MVSTELISPNAIAEAEMHDEAVVECWKNMTQNFYDIGEHAEAVYKKELFRLLEDENGRPFESGDDWLAARIPEKGRSTVYRARKYARELAIIPREERRKVKQCNAPILGQLSDEHKKDKNWVRAAQTLPEKEFVAKVKEELPEQHVDTASPMKLRPSESQRDALERGIAIAQWIQKTLEGPVDREHCIEYAMAVFRNAQCELENFQGKTNEEAYDSQHE
mgnify:CR=1 FL=1